MEEYEEVGNDARDACNAIALIAGQENEADPQTQQYQLGVEEERNQMYQLGLEAERNQESDLGVLKATSGNVIKRWRGKPDARPTKERPSSITALKMIVKQGADEKAQLEGRANGRTSKRNI